ncbi:MAG: murein biosynthesis integral membrane protein MurJ [Spirochaetales bacterium]|nr:murein biosynthesis integral membrane protein MurJ [Spirochaetales bacterium]
MSDPSKRKTGLTAVIVMICTLGSRIMGLVRNGVFNAVFGTGGIADVWHSVFMIPNSLRKLFAEGSLSSAFIPVLSTTIVEDKTQEKAKEISRKIFSFQVLILVPLIVLMIINAESICSTIFDYRDEEKLKLAVDLFRFVIIYLLFISISAVIMAVLNSNSIFIIPALTPLMFSFCVIFSIVFLYPHYKLASMVIGVLLGGITQVIVQVPLYLKKGYDFKFDFNFKTDEFKTILRLWIPFLATSSIFAINQQIAMFFATGLGDGDASALSNALIFFQLPYGIAVSSVVTVLYPRMSRESAQRDWEKLKYTFNYGIILMLMLLMPATIAYVMLGDKIIALIWQRGGFTEKSTFETFNVLAAYSLGLAGLGIFSFCQRLFYSLKNFTVPLVITFGVMLLDIILSVWLKETVLGVSGIALANSISFTIGIIPFIIFVNKFLKGINIQELLQGLAKLFISGLALYGLLKAYLIITDNYWTKENSVTNLLLVVLIVIVSMVLIFLSYYFLKIKVFRDILSSRIKKK